MNLLFSFSDKEHCKFDDKQTQKLLSLKIETMAKNAIKNRVLLHRNVMKGESSDFIYFNDDVCELSTAFTFIHFLKKFDNEKCFWQSL